MERAELWQKCIDFHGHTCGGLAIGYRAALYVQELWQVGASEDEELVCIAETDACGVDGIQVILGCTIGRGNLLFRLRGKQAFDFYERKTGRSMRLVLKEKPAGMTREESMNYTLTQPAENLFEVKDVRFDLPEKARIFRSFPCDCCGEITADSMMRLQGEKKLCLDCWEPYERFQ